VDRERRSGVDQDRGRRQAPLQDDGCRTLIKFCGMVRSEDVAVANALAVDYVGLVLYARSPRALDLVQAAALRRQLASHVAAVGLFVNAYPQQVQAAHRRIGLDVVQFHGDESPLHCLLGVAAKPAERAGPADQAERAEQAEQAKPAERAGPAGSARPAVRAEGSARAALAWWRALRIQDAETLPRAMRDYAGCEAFLVDHFDASRSPSKPSLYGGTGQRFDWSLLPAAHARPRRLILSGGLDPEHVAHAVLQVAPWAVDVSTGIQANEPRKKDAGKMQAFVAAVRAADAMRPRG